MAEDTGTPKKDGSVSVKILKNGLEASIVVTPEEGAGTPPTPEMAFAELKKAGVVYGIDTDLIHTIFKEKRFYTEITIASGTPAVDGKDAEVKYYFDAKSDLKPQEDEKGNVDYKNIQLIKSVKKGQKLAEVIPPVPGKEGKTVQDKKILPVIGKAAKIPSGPNTEASPDNPNILIASIDGSVRLSRNQVVVDSIFVIEKDVNYETGNIDYVGTLVIKGDVKSGFEVKIKGDLEINGLVEDARIIADGNVVIKNGFLGRGNGFIEAGGDVTLKFCENQNIQAKGSIYIGEAVLHSSLQSESRIEVKGSKGAIVGGVARATKGIVAKEIGNYQEIKTEVIVGIDESIIKKMQEIDEEIKKTNENLNNIKKALYTFYKHKMSGKKLKKEHEELFGKLQTLQQQIPLQMPELEEQRKKIEEEMKKYSDITVDVLGTVYPGTRIVIQKFKKSINAETKKVRFKVIEEEIKEIAL
jgi:hypothetical protein